MNKFEPFHLPEGGNPLQPTGMNMLSINEEKATKPDSRKIAEEICRIIWTRANDETANAEDDISLVKQTINYERKKVEMLREAIKNEVCYFCQKKVRRYLKEVKNESL